MAPLSAPVSAPLSAPNTSGALDESRTRHPLTTQRIAATDAARGRIGRAAYWAAPWDRARVPSKGGATPRFGAALAPAPFGAAADPWGRSPFARDKTSPPVVPPPDHGGDTLSITPATPPVSQAHLATAKGACPCH